MTVCPDDGFQPYVEDPPFDGARLCGLVDPRMWLDEEWRDILLDIKAIPPSLTFMHRKGFEWTHTIYGLRKLGALREDSKCLGVGSGHEALVYWLANNAGDVIATDLFEGEWAEKEGREGDPKTLLDPGKYAPFPYRKDRLRFMRMDGRKLEFENESFDIVLSMSSIEHFGGHENAAASMKEMGRVLRRGGVAAVVTEFVINGQRHPEFFDRDELIEHVVAPSGLKLVQAPEFRLPGHAIENPVLDPDERHMTPHLVLKVGKTLYTSVILFFRKPPE
ncbi:MAG: class I SAM-dependent methyltransferase [Candidatus Nitrospinota bacterium M3_3B_026]